MPKSLNWKNYARGSNEGKKKQKKTLFNMLPTFEARTHTCYGKNESDWLLSDSLP